MWCAKCARWEVVWWVHGGKLCGTRSVHGGRLCGAQREIVWCAAGNFVVCEVCTMGGCVAHGVCTAGNCVVCMVGGCVVHSGKLCGMRSVHDGRLCGARSVHGSMICNYNRERSDSGSPPSFRGGFNTALDAQERLARRLERAKKLTKLKKEEEQKRANGFLGLKDDRLKGARIFLFYLRKSYR